MNDEVILKTVNLKKVYNPESMNAVTALHDINIEVRKGEFLGVMGPSGSGKSTFINTDRRKGLYQRKECHEHVRQ